jgi:hypothetical protein
VNIKHKNYQQKFFDHEIEGFGDAGGYVGVDYVELPIKI